MMGEEELLLLDLLLLLMVILWQTCLDGATIAAFRLIVLVVVADAQH